MTDDSGEDTPLPKPLAHHVAEPTRTALDFDGTTDADPREPPPLPAVDDELTPAPHASSQDVTDPTRDPIPGETRRDSDDELTVPRDAPQGRRGIDDSPLIALVPPAARAGVIAQFERRVAVKGAVVIRVGESGHPLFVVVRGRLAIRAEVVDAPTITLAYVRDGEFAGEGSVLARAPSPVLVVATEDSELFALSPPDVYELARRVPAVWAELKHSAERRTRDWDALRRSSS